MFGETRRHQESTLEQAFFVNLLLGVSAVLAKLKAGPLRSESKPTRKDPAPMIPTFGAKTMSHPTTIEPTGKSATRGGNGPTTAGLRKPEPRERKGTVLIDRLCETPVTEREKYFDRKCGGLYVSIVPPCVTSFCINYTDGAGRAKSGKFAVYHPDSFRVANARARVYALKAMGGA